MSTTEQNDHVCATCKRWEPTVWPLGYCGFFLHTTDRNHGTQCTSHEPRKEQNTAAQWWAKHARMLAEVMRRGDVRKFRVELMPGGTYEFEVNPATPPEDPVTPPEDMAKSGPAGAPDWRSIADDLAAALERLDGLYQSEQDADAPTSRPEWLRGPWQRYQGAVARSLNVRRPMPVRLAKATLNAKGTTRTCFRVEGGPRWGPWCFTRRRAVLNWVWVNLGLQPFEKDALEGER